MAVGQTLTQKKAPELVPEAEEAAEDEIIDDDEEEEDDDEGEDLVPLEPELKAKDPFIGVRIRRLVGSTWFCGEVLDVEQGKESKELVYLVRYHDGDRQHLTSAEVHQWSVPRAAAAADAPVDLTRGPAPAGRGGPRRRPLGQAAPGQSKPPASHPQAEKAGPPGKPPAAAAGAHAPQRPPAAASRLPRQSAVLVSVGTQTVDIGLRPLRPLGRQPEGLSGHLSPAHGRRRHNSELDGDSELELVEENLALGRPRHRLPPPKRHRGEGAFDDFGQVWDHEDDADLEDAYSRDLPCRRRLGRPDESLHGRRAMPRPPAALLPARAMPDTFHQATVREARLALGMDSSQVDVTEVEEEYFDEEGEEEELQEYTDEEVEEEEEDQSTN